MRLLHKNRLTAAVALATSIAIGVGMGACSKALPDNVASEKTILGSITINTTATLPLLIGKDSLLPVTITPQQPSNARLTWASNDISVATVDTAGRVKAVAAGSAVITATSADGGARTASITVKAITTLVNIASITIGSTATSIFQGDTLHLTGVITPADATYTTLTWSSSDTTIAKVSQTGVLTTSAKGNVTITAVAIDGSNVKGTLALEVKEVIPVTAIAVNNTFAESMAVGEKRAISLTLSPANASAHDLTYTSGNTAVATVSSDGIVTAVTAGSAVITITTKNGNGVTATLSVTVEEGKINDVFTGTTTPWILVSSSSYPGSSYKLQNGIFYGTMGVNGSATYRGDFQRTGGITVYPGKYPIIAFKFTKPVGTAGNLIMDTNLGSYLNGNNKFTTITGKDGVQVQYANFATGTFGSSATTLSTSTGTTLTTFQIKIADFKFTADQLAAGNNTYQVYWVKSFKSVDELTAYIN